jgi:bromodomain associated protein
MAPVAHVSVPLLHRFKPFLRMVNAEDYPDYYEIVHTPMCLMEMEAKIDRFCLRHFAWNCHHTASP